MLFYDLRNFLFFIFYNFFKANLQDLALTNIDLKKAIEEN